jgi:hypothetical protein
MKKIIHGGARRLKVDRSGLILIVMVFLKMMIGGLTTKLKHQPM